MKILFSVFAILFISCNSSFEKRMYGVYSVLECEFNNKEIKQPSILFELKKNNDFEFRGDMGCSGKWQGGSYGDFELIEL